MEDQKKVVRWTNTQKRQIGTEVPKDKGRVISYTITPGKIENLIGEKNEG